MSEISIEKVRSLSLGDMNLGELSSAKAAQTNDAPDLPEESDLLKQVRAALGMGYAGIILSGPPGTGKSYFAQQLGVGLSGDWEAVQSVQFHPSYQYEDFMFGYSPNADGSFQLREKEFAKICRMAAANPEQVHVLIIDEISRSDVVRVFGEALTYIEPDKRGQSFTVACGEELTVPKNLVIIGTMNPWDKGVDELDMALERRFAQIDLEPDATVLRELLPKAGSTPEFIDRLIAFFDALQIMTPETVRLGHAYFLKCVDEASAEKVWSFRLRPTLQRACRLNTGTMKQITDLWALVVPPPAVALSEQA